MADENKCDELLDKVRAANDAGDYDEAIRFCTEAIALNPNDDGAYWLRSATHSAKGDFDRDIADLDQIIRLDPTDTAYLIRAIAYEDKGDYDRVIADYNEVIEIDPNDASYYMLRGYAYKQKGDYDMAIADLEHTLKLDPDYEYAKERLAEAQRRRDAQARNA
jgi:tetratricopeptide (TPR) repeat protein